MKIFLIGLRGQLGGELVGRLSKLGNVFAFGKDEANLEKPKELLAKLDEYSPDIVVNAAAYTAVDQAEDEYDKALFVNATAVGILANYCSEKNILLVHYSTDYVFDGTKKGSYTEADSPNPLNAYGLSKYYGELEVMNSSCSYLLFRISWVYSASPNNFVSKIIKLATEKQSLNVVNDQCGIPTSVDFISEMTLRALESYFADKLQPGLYHLTPAGEASWFEFACNIVDKIKLLNPGLSLQLKEIFPVKSQNFTQKSRRPMNSVLNSHLLNSQLDSNALHWTEYLDRMLIKGINKKYL